MIMALMPDSSFVNNVLNEAAGVITLWIPCIVALGLEVAAVILARGKRNEVVDSKKTITISKSEYDALVNENKELKKKIEELSK